MPARDHSSRVGGKIDEKVGSMNLRSGDNSPLIFRQIVGESLKDVSLNGRLLSLTGENSAIITRMAERKNTHSEDLIQPVATLKARSQSLPGQMRTKIAIILGGTLMIIGVTVSIFAHRLSARVRSLTDAAVRISIGDLAVDIPVRSRNEFGKLAEARYPASRTVFVFPSSA